MFLAQKGILGCRLVWGALLASLLVMPGCSHEKRIYQPNPPDPSVQTLPLKIAVVELEDGSQDEGWKKSHSFESFLPLVLSTPTMVKLNDTRLGRCLSAELKASRQFSVVDYHENWQKMAEQFKTYDLMMTGHLRQDKTEAINHSYGLSMAASVLGYLGLPLQSFSRHITLDVTAFKPRTPEQLLWSYELKAYDKMFSGFYYGWYTDGRYLQSKSYGVDLQNTDYCPTELLRPEFMALRNSLLAALSRL